MAIRLGVVCLVAGLFATGACGGDGGGVPGDADHDGFTPEDGDCDDSNRMVYPDAPDPCDGLDNDCNNVIDDAFDADEDGFSSCAGDCRDNDPNSNPSVTEMVDGLDNDCDGIADNHTDQYDDDGDGYSEDQGDCNDDEVGDGALIGPDAIEVNETEEGEPEEIDNDCDGAVDEGELPCPTDLDPTTPMGFAVAMDVCNEVRDAFFTEAQAQATSRGIVDDYGTTYTPMMGPNFVVLSSGIAADVDSGMADGYSREGFSSEDYDYEIDHPDPQMMPFTCDGMSFDDPDVVNDYTDVQLVLDVPANARSFSFDFNFMSVEFPEFVCDSFDDTFLAVLESQAFTGNVSFDSAGNRVSINIGLFDVCASGQGSQCTGDAELAGTGFQTGDGIEGGGTGWLTTTAPVKPGEKVRLTFMIFDEGDGIYDSNVLIDNFRWHIEEVEEPETVERVIDTRDLAPDGRATVLR